QARHQDREQDPRRPRPNALGHDRRPLVGTLPRTVVPSPGEVSIASSPPISSSRSTIPWIRPGPWPVGFGSNPRPSLWTEDVSRQFCLESITVARVASAYFATLLSASRAQK